MRRGRRRIGRAVGLTVVAAGDGVASHAVADLRAARRGVVVIALCQGGSDDRGRCDKPAAEPDQPAHSVASRSHDSFLISGNSAFWVWTTSTDNIGAFPIGTSAKV